MIVLAFIPLVAFLSIFILLINFQPQEDWRRSFQRASILWGTYLVLETEILSLFRWITPAGLAVAWSLPVVGVGIYLLLHIRSGYRIILPTFNLAFSWGERLLLLGILFICVVAALVGWLTPPQTWDVLNYHMPRVAHWAQEHSVRHFNTGIEE